MRSLGKKRGLERKKPAHPERAFWLKIFSLDEVVSPPGSTGRDRRSFVSSVVQDQGQVCLICRAKQTKQTQVANR